MIEITTISTGSKGNAYLLETGKVKVLLDCGLVWSKLQKSLNFEIPDYCMLTHEHKDHSQSAEHLMKRGCTVFATKGTLAVLGLDAHIMAWNLGINQQEKSRDIRIIAFPGKHDAAEPCWFYFEVEGKRCAYMTDMMYSDTVISDELDLLVIGVNWDEESISRSKYPPKLVERIKNSHMSLDVAKGFISKLKFKPGGQILITHLSGEYSNPELILREVKETQPNVDVRIAKK